MHKKVITDIMLHVMNVCVMTIALNSVTGASVPVQKLWIILTGLVWGISGLIWGIKNDL